MEIDTIELLKKELREDIFNLEVLLAELYIPMSTYEGKINTLRMLAGGDHDAWIHNHHNTHLPLSGVKVEVRLRNGKINAGAVGAFRWNIRDKTNAYGHHDIIFYRLLKTVEG